MGYFARKLRYQAHDGDVSATFIALIELTKKKGGKPIEFVLYYKTIQYQSPSESFCKMIRFKAATTEEAIAKFWSSEQGGMARFPKLDSGEWEKTTDWLYSVAVGALKQFQKVGMPALWEKRRKKKPLQVGNISHMRLLKQWQLHEREEEIHTLSLKLASLETYDLLDRFYVSECNKGDYNHFLQQLDRVYAEILSCTEDIAVIEAEMRYTRDKAYRNMFPKEEDSVLI